MTDASTMQVPDLSDLRRIRDSTGDITARLTLRRDQPTATENRLLHERHHAAMHEDTPLESIHMLGPEDLCHPDISFFTLRYGETPLAMGAFRVLAPGHAEIKSMHVLSEARGLGLARILLQGLVEAAAAAGIGRLSLETGSQDSFRPARQLYLNAGFSECPPFSAYRPDPMSIFMTRLL